MMRWKILTWIAMVTAAIAACDLNTKSIKLVNSIHDDDKDTTEELKNIVVDDTLHINNEIPAADVISTVVTEHGPVAGHSVHTQTNIISYFDIPYGKFHLFEEPSLPDAWVEVLSVPSQIKQCPQVQGPDDQVLDDLNCLTLSVFTSTTSEVETPKSVLFHIHDTDFRNGRANPMIYGPEHLVTKDIVLVLPNYRVGPLGFMCLQNETARGNAALKDLTLALSWTFNNIGFFGGDPSQIAVSGIGNAGALAGYLAISPKSRDYVSKVITDSGSVLSFDAIDLNPISKAEMLVEMIRKATGDHSANVFNDINMTVLLQAGQNIKFKPCIEKGDDEDGFMTETPWRMLQNINTTQAFMIGSSNYAGMHDTVEHTELSLAQINENNGVLVPRDLSFKDCEERENAANTIKTLYFDEATIGLDIEKLCLYYTDAVYMFPGIRLTRALAERGISVYFYEFNFVGELNKELISLNRPIEGAARGDLTGYVFTQEGVLPSAGSREELIVKRMTDLWANFIRTGEPVSEGIEWKKFELNEDTEEYLSIGDEIAQKPGLHPERFVLWTQLYKDHSAETNKAGTIPNGLILGTLIQTCLYILQKNSN